jgi:hypothetical protein
MLPIPIETLRLIVIGVALVSFLATLSLIPPVAILAVGFGCLWALQRMTQE